ncbi:MAG: sensor histidine kinase [Bacteroidia bacterium]|nr:sensor histidine kinase [Bacteroidia bacterium]
MKYLLIVSINVLMFLNLSIYAQENYLQRAELISNTDSAIQYIESKLAIRDIDTKTHTKLIYHLSSLYNKKSRYYKSERILNEHLTELSKKDRMYQIGLVYSQLGNTFKLKREMPEALKYYLEAKDIFEKIKSYSDLVRVYVSLAEYFRSLSEYPEGKKFIQKAFTLYHNKELKDTSLLIGMYGRFAAIQNESSPTDSSIILSLQALEYARLTHDLNAQAISLNELGFSFKNRHMVDSSRACYKMAYKLWSQIGNDADAVHALYNEALLLSHNDFKKEFVIPYYENIISLVKNKQIDYPLDQVFFELSNCYFFMGDSLQCYRIRQNYYQALLDKRHKLYDSEVQNIEEKYENEKYKKEIIEVSNELKEKKNEVLIISVSLAILIILLIVIAFLANRVNKSNKILKIKNKEKDILVQEVHHRVKNNLQFINSLINMQINSNKSKTAIASLNDFSRRIQSMALVHEMLYNKDEIAGIEIKNYFQELISSLNEMVTLNNIPIQFRLSCDEMLIESNKAMALGIIMSELVSNSIKYAFSDTQTPIIEISYKLNNQQATFIVRDNGSGADFNKEVRKNKLGMRLRDIFSRQLKGEYLFNNDNGLVYTLTFKI